MIVIGFSIGLTVLTILLINYLFPFWIFKKIDKKTKNHAGEIVARILKANSVEFLFTLVGGHVSPVLTASEKLGIRVIDVRNEATAVFAADSVARMKGSIGVAVVTAGPGLTNTITALKNAQMAESSVLVISGAAPGLTKGRGALQDIDQRSLVQSVCKYFGSATTIRDIPVIMEKAISTAISGNPGPVFIEIPIDLLYPFENVSEQLKLPKNPKGCISRIVKFYMESYLHYVFAGAFDCLAKEFKPIKKYFPTPSNRQITTSHTLVMESKRPLLVLGSQAIHRPEVLEETIASVKKLGIPVFTSGMSRGILGKQDPLLFRHSRKTALKEADLIILAGVVCDFRLDYGRALNSKAKIIAVNRSKENLKLNKGTFWNAYASIQSDVSEFLIELAKRDFEQKKDYKSWLQNLRKHEDDRNVEIRNMANHPTNVHNNPMKILLDIDEKGIEEDDIIVVDGGDFVGTASYILRPRSPLSWLDPGSYGTLGVGAGFALGAKLCRPKANIWLIYGDGSCAYSIAEWDTMKRHGIPAIGVIGNDACWSQIARDQVKILGSNVACQLAYTPYHKIGAYYASVIENKDEIKGAFLLSKENLESLPEILKECKSLSRKNIPSIINCLIGKTDFREGSISC